MEPARVAGKVQLLPGTGIVVLAVHRHQFKPQVPAVVHQELREQEQRHDATGIVVGAGRAYPRVYVGEENKARAPGRAPARDNVVPN